jgi:hypothetical protein
VRASEMNKRPRPLPKTLQRKTRPFIALWRASEGAFRLKPDRMGCIETSLFFEKVLG